MVDTGACRDTFAGSDPCWRRIKVHMMNRHVRVETVLVVNPDCGPP